MEAKINRSNMIDCVHASFVVFTRIPFLRKEQLRHAERAVEHWPLTGWTTGALQAVVLIYGARWLPWLLAIAIALCLRLLCCQKPRLFASREINITVVALYELLFSALLLRLDPFTAGAAVFASAPYAHMVCAQLTAMLPYQVSRETNGWHIAFYMYSTTSGLWLFVQGMLPLLLAVFVGGVDWQWVIFAPCVVMYFAYLVLLNRLGGYTIDTLIAVSALLEAVFCLVV